MYILWFRDVEKSVENLPLYECSGHIIALCCVLHHDVSCANVLRLDG